MALYVFGLVVCYKNEVLSLEVVSCKNEALCYWKLHVISNASTCCVRMLRCSLCIVCMIIVIVCEFISVTLSFLNIIGINLKMAGKQNKEKKNMWNHI